MNNTRLGMIGFGEVGKIFADGLTSKEGVSQVKIWDIKFWDAKLAANQNAPENHAYYKAADLAELCADSNFLISAVTASNSLIVAQEAANYIKAGAVFLDLNSASPGTKQQAATAIEAAGGIYVEAGIMTTVPPYGIKVPMLLGGQHAQDVANQLNAWGMDAKVVSPSIGVASAIKMCRSVMIKGLEALVIESYTAARAYGVEDYVLPTLQETFPSIDWSEQGAYFFSRVVQHGARRAGEMRESARTVQESGFDATLTSAVAAKHQFLADLAKEGVFNNLPSHKEIVAEKKWQLYADALLKVARK